MVTQIFSVSQLDLTGLMMRSVAFGIFLEDLFLTFSVVGIQKYYNLAYTNYTVLAKFTKYKLANIEPFESLTVHYQLSNLK